MIVGFQSPAGLAIFGKVYWSSPAFTKTWSPSEYILALFALSLEGSCSIGPFTAANFHTTPYIFLLTSWSTFFLTITWHHTPLNVSSYQNIRKYAREPTVVRPTRTSKSTELNQPKPAFQNPTVAMKVVVPNGQLLLSLSAEAIHRWIYVSFVCGAGACSCSRLLLHVNVWCDRLRL